MSLHGVRAVQELLGHSSVATTQVYTQIVDQRKSTAVLALPTFGAPEVTTHDYVEAPAPVVGSDETS